LPRSAKREGWFNPARRAAPKRELPRSAKREGS